MLNCLLIIPRIVNNFEMVMANNKNKIYLLDIDNKVMRYKIGMVRLIYYNITNFYINTNTVTSNINNITLH